MVPPRGLHSCLLNEQSKCCRIKDKSTQTDAFHSLPLAVVSLPHAQSPRTSLEGGALCRSRQHTILSGTKDVPWRARRSSFGQTRDSVRTTMALRITRERGRTVHTDEYAAHRSSYTMLQHGQTCCNAVQHGTKQYNDKYVAHRSSYAWHETYKRRLFRAYNGHVHSGNRNQLPRRRGPELGSTPVHLKTRRMQCTAHTCTAARQASTVHSA